MVTTPIDHIIEQGKMLGQHIVVLSEIKSGKEATVYRAILSSELVALKLYKNPEERSFKNTDTYILGRHYKRSSEAKAVQKNNRFGKKLQHKNWVQREFFMLQKLFEKGANIPKPILHLDDAIFMELLGDGESIAPRLSDVHLETIDAQYVFDVIMKNIKLFWDFGIVHADLSAYNIIVWKHTPYIIDFPQSIDRRMHPNATEFLERDIRNIVSYFASQFPVDFHKVKDLFALRSP